MTTYSLWKFSLALLRKRRLSHFLSAVSIFFSVLGVMLFLAFSAGIRQNVLAPLAKTLDSQYILALPSEAFERGFNPLAFLGNQQQTISAEIIEEIGSLAEVKTVIEEIRIPFPVAATTNILFGVSFDFDVMISGFPAEAVSEYVAAETSFSSRGEEIPILLSPLLVELYNSTVAELLPQASRKTQADFLGREITFTLGDIHYLQFLHSFPPDTQKKVLRGKIVGFAAFLSPFTFAIPEETAKTIVEEYTGAAAEDILPKSLLLVPKKPQDSFALQENLRKMRLATKDLSENADMLRSLFFFLEIVIFSAIAIALLVSFALLGNTLFAALQANRKNIGIWQALGMTAKSLQQIFFFYGLCIIFGPFFLAVIAALGIAEAANKAFLSASSFSFTTDHIFSFSAALPWSGMGIIFCILVLALFLFIRKGIRVSPLQIITA